MELNFVVFGYGFGICFMKFDIFNSCKVLFAWSILIGPIIRSEKWTWGDEVLRFERTKLDHGKYQKEGWTLRGPLQRYS